MSENDNDVYEGILFGVGNPLLDICANVDQKFLQQYDLKADDAILAEAKHLPIYTAVTKAYDVTYIPGGATQNAIKVAQWLLKKKHATTFAGCIKDDEFGRILKASCNKIGVNTIYQYNQGSEPTGTCAVLLTGTSRSLVTNLGAACCFNVSHLNDHNNWLHVEKAKYLYVAGFFLSSSQESLMKVAKHSHTASKTFCFNLSAQFLCHVYKEQMAEVLPYVDVLFGNNDEASAYAEANNLGTSDTKEIAQKLAALPYKNESRRARVVVITQGSDPVIVVEHGKAPVEYPVEQLPREKIVDTNGAGDAFVGAFLSQLVQGKPISECIRCGNWAGTLIIQRQGCTFPDTPDYQ